jgi:hypothetical protein
MIKIKVGFTGTIVTGEYANEKPYFEVEEEISRELNDSEIELRQQQLSDICIRQFKNQEQKAIADRIKKEREDIRFYTRNGKLYPSVTSILNWDSDFFMPPHELTQHASKGSIVHAQCEHYIKTGEWVDPLQLPECYPDLAIVKKGNLQLEIENYNFVGFLEKYPIGFTSTETQVFNDELQYAGTYDCKGTFVEKEKPLKDIVCGKVTLFDIKTCSSIDKNKFFKQLTAYAKCEENSDIEQLCVIHLKADNDSGYAKPIIETDLEKYWSLFKKDRENFKKRFGV